ncbi:hypothetical protein [Methanobrevibacter olleyae]|uniref:hypothetical protein n=1 Tax=Methanobrevibacter olleyae TaxID=294671 RepID=UPI000AF3E20D|nr:hypothetical protein [Methanobrevibacter olleyae]
MINVVVDKFRVLDDENQVNFKKKLRRYQSIYSFLSQLLPFSDLWLENCIFIINS